nr:hypothetical protein CFP56_37962 [Quercus suber]
MESDDDFQLLPQSEEISPSERKLKRLKKAIRVSTEPSSPSLDFPKSEALDSEELKELSPSGAGSESESEEGFDGGNELDFGLGGEEEEEKGLGVKTKRVLEFDSVGDDFDSKRDDPSEEMGDGLEDLRIEEPVKKRRSSDELDENIDNKKTKKKKKKNVDASVVDLDATTQKMTKRERRDNLKQLRAESQRLLRVPIHSLPEVEIVTSKRGGNFSVDEDLLLISAWLKIGMDAVHGTEQKGDKFWTKIWESFCKNYTYRTTRSSTSLSSQWGNINRETSRFAGFMAKVEARNSSGGTDEDNV